MGRLIALVVALVLIFLGAQVNWFLGVVLALILALLVFAWALGRMAGLSDQDIRAAWEGRPHEPQL